MTSPPVPDLSRSVRIAAPPQRVFELVSDLPGMGRFSPENAGGQWLGGATGPAVGVGFRGRNRRGLHRWSTRCTVTRCDPGQGFAFAVSSMGLPVADWAYDIEPDGEGCRLTETWTDRRGALITAAGRLASGVSDRAAFTAESIERTLDAVQREAERKQG
jgi:hypothetical protein